MTAAVISFDQARAARGIPLPERIRLGDKVRRLFSLAEGTVIAIVGHGSPDDPVRAVVQFAAQRSVIAMTSLEKAPKPVPHPWAGGAA